MRCAEEMDEDERYHHMIQCRWNESIQGFWKDQLAIEMIETPERDADELERGKLSSLRVNHRYSPCQWEKPLRRRAYHEIAANANVSLTGWYWNRRRNWRYRSQNRIIVDAKTSNIVPNSVSADIVPLPYLILWGICICLLQPLLIHPSWSVPFRNCSPTTWHQQRWSTRVNLEYRAGPWSSSKERY